MDVARPKQQVEKEEKVSENRSPNLTSSFWPMQHEYQFLLFCAQ